MKLELAPTIRAPFVGEMKHRTDINELLEKRKMANIVEGFMLKQNRTPQLPYTFSADINIDNSRLWNLFLSLSEELPENVNCTYKLDNAENSNSLYSLKSLIIERLTQYKLELTQECTIEFGLVSNTKQQLIEILVTPSKYIKFYGVNENSFRDKMNAFNLKEISRLEFIDEYPNIITPLNKLVKSARTAAEVIKEINEGLHK